MTFSNSAIRLCSLITTLTALSACGDGNSASPDAPHAAPDAAVVVIDATSTDATSTDATGTLADAMRAAADAPAASIDATTFTIDAAAVSDATNTSADAGAGSSVSLSPSWTPEYASLVGYWQLNGPIGDIKDGTDIPATIGADGVSSSNALPAETLGYIAGQVGNALQFDYAHNVEIAPTSTLKGSYTVQVWVRYDDANAINSGVFSTQTQDDTFNVGLYTQNSGNQASLNANIGAGASGITSSNVQDDFPAGVWHQVVYSVSPTSYAAYHNGVLVDSGTYGSATPLLYDADHPICIGSSCGTNTDFTGGAVDEVAIWNVALTANDVATLFSNGSNGIAIAPAWTPSYNDLVQYWAFDGTRGSASYGDALPALIGDSGVISGVGPMTIVSSPLGQAFEFDQNHDVLVASTGTVSGSFTVQAWVRFNSANDYQGTIFGTRDDNFFDFKINDPTRVHGDLANASDSTDATSDFSIGVWHQIVYAVSPTTFAIYHNGVLIGSGAMSGEATLYSNGSGLTLGNCGPTCGEYFGGDLDEVAIWNTTLSAADVATLYSNGSTGTAISSTAAPQFANLVNYWKLDGSIGTLDTGSTVTAAIGPNGTLVGQSQSGGSTAKTVAYVAGQIDQGLQCHGTQDRVSIFPSGSLAGSFTISTWVNPTQSTLDNGGSVLGTQYSGSAFAFRFNGDGTVHVDAGDGSSSTSTDGTIPLSVDNWHYLVYTVSGSGYALYVDGALDSTGPSSATAQALLYDPQHYIHIGNNGEGGPTQGGSFQGAEDEVGIWNTSLSDADVLALYNHGIAGQGLDSSWTPAYANLVNYWNFDQSTLSSGATISAVVGPNGTLQHSSATSIPGLVGNAIQFNGSQYVETIPSTALTGSYTVQTWVKFANNSEMSGGVFGTRFPHDQSFDIQMSGSSGVHGDYGDGTNWMTYSANAQMNFTSGAWHQIVYSVAPGRFSIYYDGAVAYSTTIGIPLLYDSNHPLALCDDSTGGDNSFEGQLDDVAIWNQALTADEVQLIYTQQASPQ